MVTVHRGRVDRLILEASTGICDEDEDHKESTIIVNEGENEEVYHRMV